MEIAPDRIEAQIQKGLAPVYLIWGEEDLLVLEAADQIRAAARAQGVDDRLVFEADAKYDWNELAVQSASMSLFSARRLIDLRLPTGKPGREGGAFLRDYCDSGAADDVLMISAGKIDASSRKSAWYKAVEKHGVVVPCWPVAPQELPRWLQSRLQARGVQADASVCQSLADRVEGNLLAAAQEVDKLALLHQGGAITAEVVEATVADNARFDVYLLTETVLRGDAVRALRILRGLRSEDMAVQIVLWALHKEVRLVCAMRRALDTGRSPDHAFKGERIWRKRRMMLDQAVRRMGAKAWGWAVSELANIEQMGKGQKAGDPWQALEQWVVRLAQKKSRVA